MDNVIQRISVHKKYSVIHRLSDFSNGWRYLHRNNRSQEIFSSVVVIFIKYFFDVEFKQSCDSRWTLGRTSFETVLESGCGVLWQPIRTRKISQLANDTLGWKEASYTRRGKTWVTVAFSCASDWLRGGVSFLDQSQSIVKHVNAIL